MLYKSSNYSREQWLNFALKLQHKSITDQSGAVKCKRDVFDILFNEADKSQVELNLVISGNHPYFALIPRPGLNEAILKAHRLSEMTRDEMEQIAVSIVRKHDIQGDFQEIVSMMVLGMTAVFDGYQHIEECINRKATE